MGLFTRNKTITTNTVTTNTVDNNKSAKLFNFAIPFLNIPKGTNLSKPNVNYGFKQNGFEPFGDNNIYPNLLEQFYYGSPIHSNCIDFTVSAVFSDYEIENLYTFNGIETLKIRSFEKKNRLRRFINNLTLNYKIHDQFFIEVNMTTGTPLIKVIDCGNVRIDYNKNVAYISDNWFSGRTVKTLPLYSDTNTDLNKTKHFIYMFQNMKVGMSTYPLPTYNSILNDLEIDREIPNIRLQALKNSSSPSYFLQLTEEITTQEQQENIMNMLNTQRKPEALGNWLVMGVDGKDSFAQLTQLKIGEGLDGLFKENEEKIRKRIQTAHRIPSALSGDSTSGSLGNNQQLKVEWVKFQYDVAKPMRRTIEEELNYLFDLIIPGLIIKLKEGDFIEAMTILDNKNKEQ